jgi:hypothetical protein
MTKNIFQFVIIGGLYLFLTFLYSIFFGLPPFNSGQVIGYPAIYYQFWISETEKQSGFMKIDNLLSNVVIVVFLMFFFRIIQQKIKNR